MDATVPALKLAAQAAGKFLQDANNSANDSAKRCENLLCAAREAIKGLYNEPAQIIVAAQYCDLANPKEVNALTQRIDDYIKLENLRLLLITAVEGLKVYLDEFSKERHFFINLLTRFVNLDKPLDRFDSLLKELTGYYEALSDAALKHRMAGTGLLLDPLCRVRNALKQGDRNALIEACSMEDLIQEANALNELTGKISRTSHELILLFGRG
jgi:hypothetical protein